MRKNLKAIRTKYKKQKLPISALVREVAQKHGSTHWQCQDFTEELIRRLKEQGESGRITGNTFHSCVYYQGRYYDAETPNALAVSITVTAAYRPLNS